MPLSPTLLESLSRMPSDFECAFRLVARDRWNWRPASWEGIPGERFTAIEQACHLRDIEIDGYHERIRRMLEETQPDLHSIDGYELARERRYSSADPEDVIAAFRAARVQTVQMIRQMTVEQLTRRATFAEHGAVTLAGLIHYLSSHDQQHLACMQWLLGRMASA
jgi:hypothetical protein